MNVLLPRKDDPTARNADGTTELQKNLVFDLALDERKELTPAERLAVIEGSGLRAALNDRILVDVLLACGCFDRAAEIYQALGHWRKLGDLAWARHDLDRAEECYRHPRQAGCDWDRLIKLAFVKQDWETVISAFVASDCEPLVKGMIILNHTGCPSGPYLRMLAVAVTHARRAGDMELANKVCQKAGIGFQEWSELLAGTLGMREQDIEVMSKRSTPRVTKLTPCSAGEAIADGKTERVRQILECVGKSSELLMNAKELRQEFLATGRSGALDSFFSLVTCFQVDGACRTFLFEAMNRDDVAVDRGPAEHRIEFYSVHPIMNKRYFRRLLIARFELGQGLCGSDVVTGLFQMMWLPPHNAREKKLADRFDFDKLSSGRDWAEARLADWLSGEGSKLAEVIRAAWRQSGWVTLDTRPGTDWERLLRSALKWLACRWEEEIAHEQWLSEAQMFQLLKRSFRGHTVERHAQPLWLGSQHLDCYIPDLKLAIEYMGAQHYIPVAFFGGPEGHLATQERDERKRRLCDAAGIRLEYIRFDEKLGERIGYIKAAASICFSGKLEK